MITASYHIEAQRSYVTQAIAPQFLHTFETIKILLDITTAFLKKKIIEPVY